MCSGKHSRDDENDDFRNIMRQICGFLFQKQMKHKQYLT